MTIWILVITLECSNITASKSIRRERKMRPMELSGVNLSTHGSESVCSCFDQVLYRIAHSSVFRRFQVNVIYVTVRFVTIACRKDTCHQIVK